MVVNHAAGAFDLPAEFPTVPGLLEDVDRLRRERRPGAALERVLQVLREDNRSAHAFECALALCSGRTPTSDQDAIEPITEDQYFDPLLAPVRTVCTDCRATWFSGHILFAAEGSWMTVSNPIGLQCPQCRYTRCRNCLTTNLRCPQRGCPGTLGTPVLATGAPPRVEHAPRTGRVEYVVVMWEGTAPGADTLMPILDEAARGQDTRGAGITVLGVESLDDKLGWTTVYHLEREGKIGPDALERTRMVLLQTPGLGRQRVFVVEDPDAADGTANNGTDGPGGAAPGRLRRWLRRPGRR